MKNLKKQIKIFLFKLFSASFVLMFHHITETPTVKKSSCVLDFEKFKSFILRYRGSYSPTENVAKRKCKRALAVTFDDGLADVYTLAYPFLKENNVPFTVFVISDFLDAEGYITTEQLLEMSADPLVTIGSHGTTHKLLPKLTRDEQEAELTESKKKLEHLIGKNVTLFAYSHGQYDNQTLSLIHHYDAAFVAGESLLSSLQWNPHLLPRFNVVSKTCEQQIAFFDKVIRKTKKK